MRSLLNVPEERINDLQECEESSHSLQNRRGAVEIRRFSYYTDLYFVSNKISCGQFGKTPVSIRSENVKRNEMKLKASLRHTKVTISMKATEIWLKC